MSYKQPPFDNSPFFITSLEKSTKKDQIFTILAVFDQNYLLKLHHVETSQGEFDDSSIIYIRGWPAVQNKGKKVRCKSQTNLHFNTFIVLRHFVCFTPVVRSISACLHFVQKAENVARIDSMLESVILTGRLTLFGKNRRSSNLKIAKDSC